MGWKLMCDDKLKLIYNAQVKKHEAQSSVAINPKIVVKWVPILSYGNPPKIIGITQDGEWGTLISEGFCIINKPHLYLYIMSLLENKYDKLISLLIHELPTEINLYDVLPDVELLKYTFEYEKSSYWLVLAFDWFDQVSIEKQYAIIDSMLKVEKNKCIDQRVRHLAKDRTRRLR